MCLLNPYPLAFLPTRRHGEYPINLHISEWGTNGMQTWESVFLIVTHHEK